MNYMRPFFLFLLFFLDAFPYKTRIAAGILRIPQKQESSYPSLQEVLRPTRPLAPRPLHEQAYRGRGGIAVVGERTAVMAVTLSKSEAIARAQIVGQKSVQQVIQELTQVKSNATVNELLSVLQLTVQQAKTIKLIEVQIAYFKTFTIAQWQEYLKNALGLVPYGTVGWDTIFELYAFYQFPLFRQHLQTIPEYTRSMAHLYEKLDPRSTKYDKDLADRIADTQEGLELYESMRNNAFVNQKIEEEAKKETQKFEKLPSEEQYALIETKKAERAKISVGYAQRNSKANVSPQNEQEELKKRLSNLKDELLLKVKEREIALATAQADQAKAKFEKEVREKEFAELQDIERALKTNVDQAKNEYQKVQEKYDATRAQIKNHNDKTTHQEQELRKIVLEELLPIQNKRAELIEKLEQVQARIYIQKFADKLINQERVRALNNEKIQNTAKLTPKAQEMFKKAGYDFGQYQEGIQSKLRNQMSVEGITLLNRVKVIR